MKQGQCRLSIDEEASPSWGCLFINWFSKSGNEPKIYAPGDKAREKLTELLHLFAFSQGASVKTYVGLGD
jgi:hypothetical protein